MSFVDCFGTKIFLRILRALHDPCLSYRYPNPPPTPLPSHVTQKNTGKLKCWECMHCFAIYKRKCIKIQKIGTWNFDTIFIQVFNLWYTNLGSISLIVWKLYAFRERTNFGHFQQFSHHNFRLKWKFWIQMFSSVKSSSDLSEYTYFKWIFDNCIGNNHIKIYQTISSFH